MALWGVVAGARSTCQGARLVQPPLAAPLPPVRTEGAGGRLQNAQRAQGRPQGGRHVY